MNQAARHCESLPTPPDGWLTIDQVCEALGKSWRTIHRWIQSGKLVAQLCDGTAGATWYVDPACKPALWLAAGHTDPVPALAGDAIAGLTDAKRGGILDRRQILAAYEQAMADRPAGRTIADWGRIWLDAWRLRNPGRSLSLATIYRWRKAAKTEGLAGLADRRGGFAAADVDPDLWQLFRGLYLRQNRMTIREIYAIVAAEAKGRPWPSLSTIRRRAKRDISPILVAAGQDPKRFEDRFIPYADRDWSQVPAMACWIADNRKLDVYYRHRKAAGAGGRGEWERRRAWIQVWIDARSWYPVAWRLTGPDEPDAISTAELFAAGVSLHGAPDEILLDNGSGFRADAFSGGRPNKRRDDADAEINPIVAELGTRLVRFAAPYNHKAKPIEPWFKFVSSEFDKLFSGYVGHSISVRPLDVDEVPIFELPTLRELREMFGTWLTQTFCRMPSPAVAAAGLSPVRAFAELRDPARQYTKPTDEVLCLLCRPSRPVRVTQRGVYVREFDATYWDRRLVERQGSGRDARRKVSYRYLPGRPETVFIFDEKGRFYCTAGLAPGESINPLIDADRDPADAGRLAEVMELKGAMRRHYNRQVQADRDFADNHLLAAQHRGQVALGKIDDAPAPPEPTTIKLAPHLEDGARLMDAEQSGQAKTQRDDERTAKARMLDFYGRAAEADAATCEQRSAVDPLDLLADADQDQADNPTGPGGDMFDAAWPVEEDSDDGQDADDPDADE